MADHAPEAVEIHDFVEARGRGVCEKLMGPVAVELEAGHEWRGLYARSGERVVAGDGAGHESAVPAMIVQAVPRMAAATRVCRMRPMPCVSV